ncbi:MAG: pentapeptide repeat-containing protein [Clostridia bacterium]|nr:pentapeptide repeat-containing protein [Clostridia bacterium]
MQRFKFHNRISAADCNACFNARRFGRAFRAGFVGTCFIGACFIRACFVGACFIRACFVRACFVGACFVGACFVGRFRFRRRYFFGRTYGRAASRITAIFLARCKQSSGHYERHCKQ